MEASLSSMHKLPPQLLSITAVEEEHFGRHTISATGRSTAYDSHSGSPDSTSMNSLFRVCPVFYELIPHLQWDCARLWCTERRGGLLQTIRGSIRCKPRLVIRSYKEWLRLDVPCVRDGQQLGRRSSQKNLIQESIQMIHLAVSQLRHRHSHT